MSGLGLNGAVRNQPIATHYMKFGVWPCILLGWPGIVKHAWQQDFGRVPAMSTHLKNKYWDMVAKRTHICRRAVDTGSKMHSYGRVWFDGWLLSAGCWLGACDERMPAESSQQRAASREQPALSSRQPAASTWQPAASSQQPVARNQQPAAGRQHGCALICMF